MDPDATPQMELIGGPGEQLQKILSAAVREGDTPAAEVDRTAGTLRAVKRTSIVQKSRVLGMQQGHQHQQGGGEQQHLQPFWHSRPGPFWASRLVLQQQQHNSRQRQEQEPGS